MRTFKELPIIVTSLVADPTSFDVVVAFVVKEDFSIFFQLWMLHKYLVLSVHRGTTHPRMGCCGLGLASTIMVVAVGPSCDVASDITLSFAVTPFYDLFF